MKIKVGDIVRNEVLKSQVTKTQLVKDLQKSRTWLDNILREDEMELKYILGLGNCLGIDFAELIPTLKEKNKNQSVSEQDSDYTGLNPHVIKSQMIEVQAKYISLLEDHIKLMNENIKK